MNAVIRSIGAYVPSRRMSNDEFPESLNTSHEWIVSHTGIHFRHIAAEDEASSDLAVKACQAALERAGLKAEDIGMILVATATSDFIGFPATACIVQDALGAVNAGSMDIVAGCTGFIYGLETAKGYISSGYAKHVLVCGAESLTRITDWEDRDTCVLFGDGAAAAVVSADASTDRGILFSYMRTDGSGAHLLQRTAGGSRYPFKVSETDPRDLLLTMDGRQVYNFAVRVIVESIRHILEQNSLTIEDIKYIVPHQANIRIIEAAARRAKMPKEKFFVNIQEYANTSAATIPIALNELHEKKLISEGDLIVTVGFGAGLTYGGNLIRW
jgi:3-oxoacyl-[acyl-carrier-protein] synthase-3